MCSVAFTIRSGRCRRSAARVFEERLGVLGGVLGQRLALGRRVANDLVVHVGDVHDVVHLVAAIDQPAAQNVLESEGPQVADVGVIVDRGAAGVHAHGIAFERLKRLHLLGESVVETKGH